MNFRKISPPHHLRNHVRYFWSLENREAGTLPKTFVPIADGCPGIMFHHAENRAFYDQFGNQWPGLLLYGQTTTPIQIHAIGRFHSIGAFLYPNSLRSIFGFDAGELTDACLDLNLLTEAQGFHLSERLLNASTVVGQIKILSSYLSFQTVKNHAQVDRMAQYAMLQIIQSQGNLPLKKLQQDLQLSERSLERMFKQSVGISPKLFSRVCRFQASFRQLRSSNYDKLSDIALENGYADQSHFVREFKEFVGFSPHQYRSLFHEVLENFPELRT